MTTTTFTALAALVTNVLADGQIDSEEIEQLRTEIYDDGTVDADEAAAIFELNEKCSGYVPEWVDFATQVIFDFAAADGEIDQNEATFIRSSIESDGVVDAVEKAILTKLLESGATMPSDFETWARSVVS